MRFRISTRLITISLALAILVPLLGFSPAAVKLAHAASGTQASLEDAFNLAVANGRWKSADGNYRPVIALSGVAADWGVLWINLESRVTQATLEAAPTPVVARWSNAAWLLAFPGEPDYTSWLAGVPDSLVSSSLKTSYGAGHPTNAPSRVATVNAGKYPWLGDKVVTQGNNGAKSHSGSSAWAWDFVGVAGDATDWPVYAAHMGTVAYVQTSTATDSGHDDSSIWRQANVIVVKYYDGGIEYANIYLHLAQEFPPRFQVGDAIVAGQLIAHADQTGWTTATHLHFATQNWMDSWDNNANMWLAQSVPSSFAESAGGVPVQRSASYASSNTAWDPPVGPVLQSPGDFSSIDGSGPTFSWQSVYNAYQYEVQVWNVGQLTWAGGATTSQTSWQLPASLAPGEYRWRVRARFPLSGGGSYSAWSMRTFAVGNACTGAAQSGLAQASSCNPPPNDTTPPSGSFTSPSNGATISSGSVTISVNASDNAGGSGVQNVRFSALWGGTWRGIGVASTAPYSINWDMCAAGVANGDVELGMEVWDNSNNKWVYSDHYTNPHITKNYNCGADPNPPPQGNGVDLFTDPNYGGSHFASLLTYDLPNLGAATNGLFHDNIESAKVYGGYAYVLYENENYSGAYIAQTGDPNLGTSGWANRADSIRVRSGDYNSSAFTLYGLGDFNGEAWSSDRTIYDLSHWGKNDWAQSLRVASGYGIVACVDDNFHNSCGRATGPAQFSDINALAQGLRNGVSSIRVCSGACPSGASATLLAYPADGQHIASGTTIVLQWYGGGDQFKGELWGGGLGSTQSWGWSNDTQFSAGQLPVSANPYYWRVQASNGFGDSGWVQGSFYVDPPTVEAISAFVMAGTTTSRPAAGSATWPAAQAVAAGSARPSAAAALNAGQSVQLFIRAQNTTGAQTVAHFNWTVTDPIGRRVPALEWDGDLNTPDGTVDWYLPTALPAYAITGQYTFVGTIAFNGQTTAQTAQFDVQGPDTAEVFGVFTTDTNGPGTPAASSMPKTASPKLPATNQTAFNAGDPIRLYFDVYNNATYTLTVHFRWWLIDPQGRTALFYEQDADTGTGWWWWWWSRTLPSDLVSGTYDFIGEATYGNRVTRASTLITVNGAPPPAVDDIQSPGEITDVPSTIVQDTWNTTAADTDPVLSCTNVANSNSVWYKFTVPSTGWYSLSTLGSNYDTVVAAFAGTPGNLSEVACNDDYYGMSTASYAQFNATGGATYYVVVMDWDAPGGGELDLTLAHVNRSYLPSVAR